MNNIILNADSYKASHFLQYPESTKYVSSYIEARAGEYNQVVFFGLQAFIKKYLLSRITETDVAEAKNIISNHGLPFYEAGWNYILEKHAGLLPLKIQAVAEGSVVPVGNVLCQVVNTDPNCFWVTSYIETALLRAVWYPSTIATRSYHIKQKITDFLLKTADSLSGLPFMLHDFGARGVSSLESAELGGMAHMLNFLGSDNLSAIFAASKYYNAEMAAYSIPAAEHGTVTSWGSELEEAAYRHILESFQGYAAVSVVSDSYDLFYAIEHIWGKALKHEVEKFGGVVVIRPDSGEPVSVIRKTLRLLAKNYGVTKNSKGYNVLPPCIRVIQGDGISEATIEEILTAITADGFSAENIVFGMGAELLQKLNRDTLGFAMKVSAVNINGVWQGVAKQPKTDSFKISRRGRLALVDNQTILLDDLGNNSNQLLDKYVDGAIIREELWSDIKDRIA